MKNILSVISKVLFTVLIFNNLLARPTTSKNETTIHFEKSPYGLLFTEIEVNGKKVKAMIDFGDPHKFQLSETLVRDQEIAVTKTDAIAMDVAGNQFEVNEGVADQIKVGSWKLKKQQFSSSPGEMESVSKQIGTVFNAVVGWGFFSGYYIEMDYAKNKIEVFKNELEPSEVLYSANLMEGSSYLILENKMEGKKTNLLLDTGSPFSNIDSTYFYNNISSFSDTTISFEGYNLPMKNIKTGFDNTSFTNPYYITDLSAINRLNAVGIIGGDVLSRFKIYINPKKHIIQFYE